MSKSKAAEFVETRQKAVEARPKIELMRPGTDNKCLFRVGRDGELEYHCTSEFKVFGEHQGETYPQYSLSAQDALKLAAWIQETFK
jgi:hypothetical protein